MSDWSLAAECNGDHIGVVGHVRVPMAWRHHDLTFVCPNCGYMATREQVRHAIPEPYRPSSHALAQALQSMADYRLVVVFGRGEPHVEYPRPSLDPVR